MSTQRQEKVNSLLQKEIAQYLRQQDLEDLRGLVTIIGVDSTPDLEYAKVFFSVIGQKPEEVGQILKKNIYELQGTLNRKLRMRKIPRVSFVYDESGEYAQRIGKAIKSIHGAKDDQPDKPDGRGQETDLGS